MLLMWFAVGGNFVCGIFFVKGGESEIGKMFHVKHWKKGVGRENDGMNPVYQRVSMDDLEGVGELLRKGVKRDG